MEYLTSLLSQQTANAIFMVLFVGGLGLAIVSLVLGNITDAVEGLFDGIGGGIGDSLHGFGWISFTTICIGVSGTGAGGFLFNSLNIPPILVVFIGLAIGFVCTFVVGRFIIVPIKRRQYSGVSNPEEAVGMSASVIAPMTNGAMGEVMVAGRSLTAKPISPDLVFATGDIAFVVRVEGTVAYIDQESSMNPIQEEQTKEEQ